MPFIFHPHPSSSGPSLVGVFLGAEVRVYTKSSLRHGKHTNLPLSFEGTGTFLSGLTTYYIYQSSTLSRYSCHKSYVAFVYGIYVGRMNKDDIVGVEGVVEGMCA